MGCFWWIWPDHVWYDLISLAFKVEPVTDHMSTLRSPVSVCRSCRFYSVKTIVSLFDVVFKKQYQQIKWLRPIYCKQTKIIGIWESVKQGHFYCSRFQVFLPNLLLSSSLVCTTLYLKSALLKGVKKTLSNCSICSSKAFHFNAKSFQRF